MKKSSQRAAALTSSITAGLILLAVALTALLAYRAFDASRAQRQMSEQTLREYASFAAFQLKNAVIARAIGAQRQAFDLVVRSVITRGPTPHLSAQRVAELVEERREQCRCLDSVSFYYRVTYADSAIEATASELATAANLGRIRDTVMAHPVTPGRIEPALPNSPGVRARIGPAPAQFLVVIFSSLDDRSHVFTHTITVDPTGKPIVAYGYAVPTGEIVARAVTHALATHPVLPTTLTRGLSMDSILAVAVSTPSREVVYESNTRVATPYSATDSVEARVGGLRFEVAINPAAAGRLIIGGLPRSRLPEVLATTVLAIGLLGLLLYQFRRQEELGRLRDDFVSGVSHELRTPLAQIRLLAELLRLGKVPTEEQKERSLRIIDKEARRLSFLVDSILSFNNARPGQLAPVKTDIAAEIEEIISGFEPLAQAQGVRLTPRLERGIVADVDRGVLRQVLLNLLDNAVRYGPPNQNVTITTASTKDGWTLEVADEGPGIPPEEADRIFAPYYRMERDAGGAVGGTGIGLAVVRGLVQEHGGRVHVASSHGAAGARFVVALPMAAPAVT